MQGIKYQEISEINHANMYIPNPTLVAGARIARDGGGILVLITIRGMLIWPLTS